MSLCHIFICKILLNILQCQLIKKSSVIDCVLPEKENLLGSAHAQRRYNASPTSGVQHGHFEKISYF